MSTSISSGSWSSRDNWYCELKYEKLPVVSVCGGHQMSVLRDLVNHDGTVQHSGLREIYAGEEAADFIGVKQSDERVPDVIGIAQVGVVCSSPTKIKKIAEHDGGARQDRHVPIIVWVQV